MKNYLWLLIVTIMLLLISCEKKSTTTEPTAPEGSIPAKPSFYQVVAIVQEPVRGMYLTIYDASDNEDGFVIERKKSGGSFTQLVTLPANSESYDDWGPLETSTSYTYRIKAYNQYGSSDWSERTQTSAGEQPGTVSFYPDADSYVEEANPTRNNGSDGYLLVDGAYDDPGNQMISYIRFPYQQYIPSYAVYIDKAELRLICQNEPAAGNALVTVHRIDVSWDENSINWNNKPNPSYAAIGVGTPVNNDGEPVYFDVTHPVRDWLDGTVPNYGFALVANNSIGMAVLYSRERSQVKPLLTVDYLW